MSEIIVGCALSDVNRADLPRNLRVPERLNDYIELYQARLASSAVLLEIQPEDLWTVPATFPDQFIPRKNNRWWRTVQAQPELHPQPRRALVQFFSQVRSHRGDETGDGVCRVY
ncbi:MAG: hypothetical protein DCC52_17495 [Chloroflexi bacterium]|nr:MAG: hypothetical protein DCC52_17495 [Chloroflexota bacterium]